MNNKHRKNFERLIHLGREVSDATVKKLGELHISDQNAFLIQLQFSFFVRAQKTFRAMKLVWSNGYPEDALVLLRSQFEAWIQLLFVANDPDNAVERGRGYNEFRFYSRYLEVRKSDPEQAKLFVDRYPRDFEELAVRYPDLEKKYKNSHWYGMSFGKLTSLVGQRAFYDSLYDLSSWYAHANPITAASYLDFSPRAMSAKPNAKDSNYFPMLESVRYVIGMSEVLNNQFNLGLTDYLQSACEKFKACSDVWQADQNELESE